MTGNFGFTAYDEPIDRAFDEDTGDRDLDAYEAPPSRAMRNYPIRENRLPLFLADDAEASRQRGFGSGGEEMYRDRPAIWPRIFKAGIFIAVMAGIAFAIASIDDPLAMFADAKASLPDLAAGSVAPSTPPLQSGARVQAVGPTAGATPTRDEITAALRVAHQGQPEIPRAAKPPSDADKEMLLKQFQAWAAEQDARAQAGARRASAGQ
jgi:hypothetical protein